MSKTKKQTVLFIIIMILIVLFMGYLMSKDVISKVSSSMNKLKGNYVENKRTYNKPVIFSIINSSGEEKVKEDVALIISVKDDYGIKDIEYSLDNKNWKSIKNVKKQDNVYTGKVVFSKNINKEVYIRAVNKHSIISDYIKTRVIIDKEN